MLAHRKDLTELDKPIVGKVSGKGPGKRGKLTLDDQRGYQLDLFDIHSDHDEHDQSNDDNSPGPTNDTNYVRLSCEGVLWALWVLSVKQRSSR
ncbi:hypothetical protein N7490_005458 [Penicillium lividum]|nr:hypothetical protein N7490_005458 [Penicillium lividum]